MTNEQRMNKLQTAADYIRAHVGTAEIGVVLGSGLGNYVTALTDAKYVDYADIPGFPISTAPDHAGRWWTGMLQGKRVCMMQGRFHAYEGYGMDEVTMYVRVMKLLGVKSLILTNAAGCVNLDWTPGTLMMISDHINYAGMNPLIGPNLDAFGPRFPDMSTTYTPRLREICRQQAEALGITLREGVYMWFSGPSYETPAEIRMARVVGADAIGMSTAPEAIIAAHCGMEVLGISCMTNMAAGICNTPLSHKEVTEIAAQVEGRFRQLLDATIHAM